MMPLGKLFARRRELVIEPLHATDAGAIADLHADGFGRAWSDEEFLSLLSKQSVFGFAARRSGRLIRDPDGFVLARIAGDEGEILTIAVARAMRGRGIGRDLMEAVMRHLYAEGAECLFLEVEQNNRWALNLYRRLGFREAGQRTSYYPRADGGGTALVMRLDLR